MFKLAFILAGSLSFLFTSTERTLQQPEVAAMLEAHLPAFQESATEKVPAMRVEHVQASNFALLDEPGYLRLAQDEATSIKYDLPHLIYELARRAWLKKGLFPVHASCVGNEATGYALLIGPSGAGKTSTALELVAHHQQKLFSGDKTLIEVDAAGQMWAIAGTRTLTTRLETPADSWQGLVASTRTLGGRHYLKLQAQYVAPLTRVAVRTLVVLQAYHTETRAERLHFPETLYRVYPFFTDQERRDIILGQGQTVLRGDIGDEAERRNIGTFARAIKNVRVLNITGSLAAVTAEIAKELQP